MTSLVKYTLTGLCFSDHPLGQGMISLMRCREATHLWHPFGRHEAGHLDDWQPSRQQLVNKLNLHAGGNHRLLVLEAVTWTNLHHLHVLGYLLENLHRQRNPAVNPGQERQYNVRVQEVSDRSIAAVGAVIPPREGFRMPRQPLLLRTLSESSVESTIQSAK